MRRILQTLCLFLIFTVTAFAQNTIPELLQQGKESIVQGDRAAAIHAFTAVLKQDKNNWVALENRANIFLEIGKYGKGKHDAKMLMKLFPDYYGGYFIRAKVRFAHDNLTGALKDLNKTLEIKPNFTEAKHLRGIIKGELGDMIGNIEDQTDILKTDSTNTRALLERSNAKMRLQDFRGAIQDADAAIAADPQLYKAYLQRGYIKYLSGDKIGAVADTRFGERLRHYTKQNIAEAQEKN